MIVREDDDNETKTLVRYYQKQVITEQDFLKYPDICNVDYLINNYKDNFVKGSKVLIPKDATYLFKDKTEASI
jgi:hypothetical protein